MTEVHFSWQCIAACLPCKGLDFVWNVEGPNYALEVGMVKSIGRGAWEDNDNATL